MLFRDIFGDLIRWQMLPFKYDEANASPSGFLKQATESGETTGLNPASDYRSQKTF